MKDLKKHMNGSPEILLLAGGEGTRLRPITFETPKHLIKIGGKELLEYTLETLPRNHKIKLLAGYMAEKYIEFARNRNIEVIIEKTPLGTGGAIRNATVKTSYVLNADIYAKIDFEKIKKFFYEKNADGVIVVKKIENVRRFGVVIFDKNKKIKNFLEKPKNIKSGFINAGVYFLGERFIEFIKTMKKTPLSIERDVFPQAAAKLKLYAFETDTEFIDTGTPESLIQFMKMVLKKPLINGRFSGKILGTCDIHKNAAVINSVIKDSIIMSGSRVTESIVENSIIAPNSIVEKNCKIKNMVVAPGTVIKAYTNCYENS